MLVSDIRIIGNKLYEIRTKKLMSRLEVAEKAELSDRTYADIERGNTTMRLDTLLKICNALNITPNDILVTENDSSVTESDIVDAIAKCNGAEKETALKLLSVYIGSLNSY